MRIAPHPSKLASVNNVKCRRSGSTLLGCGGKNGLFARHVSNQVVHNDVIDGQILAGLFVGSVEERRLLINLKI